MPSRTRILGGRREGAAPRGGSTDGRASIAPPAYGIPFLDRHEPSAPNRTGLPDSVKAWIESASGQDLSGVRVHPNSDQPVHVGALAYTRGEDIHVAPGQEKHLAHEAWHVVQQKQGRVKPRLWEKGVPINDDPALEREADAMARLALRGDAPTVEGHASTAPLSVPVVQRQPVVFNPNTGRMTDLGGMTPAGLEEFLESLPFQYRSKVENELTAEGIAVPGSASASQPAAESKLGAVGLAAIQAGNKLKASGGGSTASEATPIHPETKQRSEAKGKEIAKTGATAAADALLDLLTMNLWGKAKTARSAGALAWKAKRVGDIADRAEKARGAAHSGVAADSIAPVALITALRAVVVSLGKQSLGTAAGAVLPGAGTAAEFAVAVPDELRTIAASDSAFAQEAMAVLAMPAIEEPATQYGTS